MERAQIKVYAAFHPAGEAAYEAVAGLQSQAVGLHDEQWLFYEEGLLRIAFEGICFPVEDVLDALGQHLSKECQGKLDELQLDTWELHRHIWEKGSFMTAVRSLNHVLDYSGH